MNSDVINQIKNNLDKFSTLESNYEFENFFINQFTTPARQLIAVMQEMEKLHTEIDHLSNSEIYHLSNNNADITRTITLKRKKLSMLLDWYKEIENPDDVLRNFENEEPIYWSSYLGRTSAIELLTYGATTKSTMEKMSLLPLSDFEEAVKYCVKFASMIKSMTQATEEEMAEAQSNIVKT